MSKTMEVILITGRSLSQGREKEGGKLFEAYRRAVAICELDPEDLEALGIKEGENVRVRTDFGSIVVKPIPSPQAPHRGIAFMPYGPWASMVMNSETHGTGMPTLKGLRATIEPTKEPVASLKELYSGRLR
jgi:formylmethanofuran dehydrogenase subunit D